MKNPKLVTAIVLITHASDDGYSAEEKFFSAPPTKNPAGVLLDALQELTRMTALYGYAEQAKARFDKMQATMADFHAQRGGAVSESMTNEEVHTSLSEQREAICRAWNNLSQELRTSEELKPLWKAFQWSHEYVAELREKKLVQVTALPEDIVVSPAMWNAGASAAREYFEETGGNNPAVIYRAMRAVAIQEGV